jgi:hypothetical protein
VSDRHAPPAIAPTLVLGLPPPPEPPLEVEEGVEDVPVPGSGVLAMPVRRLVLDGVSEEVVLERETTDGVLGVASGSLPAAFARVTSNKLSYV